jgi:hypothetical protein
MTKSSNHSRSTFLPQAQKQIKEILSRVAHAQSEIDTILPKFTPAVPQRQAIESLRDLFLKFHAVVKQLQHRQRDREPFQVKDEYDVQDLLCSLLQIHFEDIRPEEYCPSYAGTRPRIDFFLKREQIAIEAKMTDEKHGRKRIREELILDKEYYSKKNDVRILYCMVYDPEELIANPRGFEDDLHEKSGSFEAKVFIVPRKA